MHTPARFQLDLFDCHDRFIAACRTATAAFPLWNAYLRSWLLWSILSALSLKRARMDAEAGTSADRWDPVEHFDQAEFWYQVPAGLPDLLRASLADVETVGRGEDPEAAASRICDRLRRAPFVPPLFNFGDLGSRYYDFTRMRRLRMLFWVKTTAPRDFRRLLTPDNVTAVAASH
jgi:tetracycline 7-halogenase / FADH2 O2-dependent halogenase